jgi:predicted GNAT family N-acyltransferase
VSQDESLPGHGALSAAPDPSFGAQLQAISFYEKLGYQCYGDEFMDAGIAHRHMEKTIQRTVGGK